MGRKYTWLTIKEAAELVGRDVRTVSMWCRIEEDLNARLEALSETKKREIWLIERESLLRVASRKRQNDTEGRSSASTQRLKAGIRKLASEVVLPERKIGDQKPLRLIAEAGGLPRNKIKAKGTLAVTEVLTYCKVGHSRGGQNLTNDRILRYVQFVVNDTLKKHPLCVKSSKFNREYNFIKYKYFGLSFAKRLAIAVARFIDERSSCSGLMKNRWAKFTLLFDWLLHHLDDFPIVKSSLLSNITPSLESWESCIMVFRQELIKDPEENILTKSKNQLKHQITSMVNLMLEDLARAGLFPHIRRIKTPPGWNKGWMGGRKKTLAELPQKKRSDSAKRVYEEAQLGVDRYANNSNFIATLISENVSPAQSPGEQARQYAEIITKRLDTLRSCAEREFLYWWSVYEYGQKLLCDQNLTVNYEMELDPLIENYIQQTKEEKASDNRLGIGLRNVLFVENHEMAIARFLQIIEYRWSGLTPPNKQAGWELALLCNRFMGKYSPRETIDAYMNAHPHLTIALRVILMVDTGVNVNVLTEMPYDCLRKTEREGEYKVDLGIKGRSGYEAIYDVFPEEDGHELSTIRAIRLYQKMTGRLRKVAQYGVDKVRWSSLSHIVNDEYKGVLHNYLFISRRISTDPLTLFAGHGYGSSIAFRKFTLRHDELKNISYTQDSIRPSILLRASIDDDGDATVAQIIADHASDSTTSIYINKYPLQLIWTHKVRYFQNLLEAVMIQDIDDGWKKLGMIKQEFDALLSEANRTGLGVSCLNPRSGIQKNVNNNEICDKQENCPSCSMRFVPATPANVLDLVLFNRFLKSVQPEMEVQQPERWAGKWMEWLAFTEVALDKLARGVTAKVFADAMAKSGTIDTENRFRIY